MRTKSYGKNGIWGSDAYLQSFEMACLLFYGRLPKTEKKDLSETGKQTQWLIPEAFEQVVFPKVQMKLVEQLDKNRNNSNPF